jgi:hypothetical protein
VLGGRQATFAHLQRHPAAVVSFATRTQHSQRLSIILGPAAHARKSIPIPWPWNAPAVLMHAGGTLQKLSGIL